MATVNPNLKKLAQAYLFKEIDRKVREFSERNPGIEVIRLTTADTSQPIPQIAGLGIMHGGLKLTHPYTYAGYGDDQGDIRLREALAARYRLRALRIDPSWIFISNGAKEDLAAIQYIFGPNDVVAVQDPVYTVYVESNVAAGRTGDFKNGRYEGIVYMPCIPENGFFPRIPDQEVDLIYVCNPNNPTGAVATREQLKAVVEYAIRHGAIIIYDAAYAKFISSSLELPRSIYEIDGAITCAIEINSFSKEAGFTGVRLGWTIIPDSIVSKNSATGELKQMWKRRLAFASNAVSRPIQEGGIYLLSDEGQRNCEKVIDYYMANARILRAALETRGLTVYGGIDAPYLWVETPKGMTSWQFFDVLLQTAHVAGIPGVGFGPSGEGFMRLHAFEHRDVTEKAADGIRNDLRF